MNRTNQLFCIWGGYAFLPLYGIGFVLLAGFIPIPSPSVDAAQIVANFEVNHTRILLGMVLCIFASACLAPWCVALFQLMRRIEQEPRTLSYMQLAAGAVGVVFFMAPCFVWGAMAYRPGHSPDLMLFMNDLAWIAWVVSVPTFILQSFLIGFCALSADPDQKTVPRWLAYLSIWLGITLLPAGCVLMFKSGPFAWNGLIAVYLPLGVYIVWYHAMLLTLLRSFAPSSRQDRTAVFQA